jgi:hypothetical protein
VAVRGAPEAMFANSQVMVLTKNDSAMAALAAMPRLAPVPPEHHEQPWTDDYSNILAALFPRLF